MFGDFFVPDPGAFLSELEAMHAGKLHVAHIDLKNSRSRATGTRPLRDFQFPQGFPDCCSFHKGLLYAGMEYFYKFPNCCDAHKNLDRARWFKKSDYAYFPVKLIMTVLYTIHAMDVHLDKEDWFDAITEYIDYTAQTFGQFPEGCGAPMGLHLYYGQLKNYLNRQPEVPREKNAALVAFLEEKTSGPKTQQLPPIDLNLLMQTYFDWLNVFPFQLSYFQHLKPYFQNRMPIIKDKPKTNRYTKFASASMLSVEELMKFLTDATLEILKEINALNLYEAGKLQDASGKQLELLIAKRKTELRRYAPEHQQSVARPYENAITQWMEEERTFLAELVPLLKDRERQKSFIDNIMDGIRDLQNQDTNADCIVRVRKNLADKESAFRYWFKTFLGGRYPDAILSAEEEKGDKKIDLKVSSATLGEKIVEFKGWWNHSKYTTTEQLCGYLTDTHNEGYIFMINHNTVKNISGEYKTSVTTEQMGYIPGSWQQHNIPGTNHWYYASSHRFGIHTKLIYHIIFNVHFSAGSTQAEV